MADKKITQLPNATTPLSGAEILPLVQSGTTKEVSLTNLTAGRNVTAAKLGVSTSPPVLNLEVMGEAGYPTLGVASGGFKLSSINEAYGLFAGVNGSNGKSWLQAMRADSATAYNIVLNPSGGNVEAGAGNFVVGTAGKGIDFSANTHAAGMTSEVLDWYEEGVFTPTWGGSGGDPTCSYTSQTGRYTRIGDMVYCWVEIVTSAASGGSGNLQIKGLPFSAKDAELNAGFASGFSANYPSGCYANSTTTVTMTGTVPGVEQAYLAIITLGASSYLACRINYRVA